MASICGVDNQYVSMMPAYLRKIENTLTLTDYCRYRDDTKVMDNSNNVEEIIRNLQGVALGIFPPTIPISFEITIFYGSFLDVVFFRNVSSNLFSTTVRMNLSSPSKWADASSSSTPAYLVSPFLSNLIRAYRITNEEKLYLRYITFLQSEMRNAKYSKDVICKVTTSALNHIEKNICKRTLRSLRDKSYIRE